VQQLRSSSDWINEPYGSQPNAEYRTRIKPSETPAIESLQPIMIETLPGLEEIVPGYLAARREELPGMIALLAADHH
jgi:hypothetical protein